MRPRADEEYRISCNHRPLAFLRRTIGIVDIYQVVLLAACLHRLTLKTREGTCQLVDTGFGASEAVLIENILTRLLS